MTESDLIYLDNAATTFPKPEVVYQEMDSFYRNYGGNARRGSNPLARRASNLVEETRALLSTWLNVHSIVFTPSSTIALNMLLQGSELRTGDVVYVTPFEHNSILRPLEHLRQRIGIEVRLLPFNRETFTCDVEEVSNGFAIDPPTLVCLTQASNVFGVMPPIEPILRSAKATNPNAVTIVDGSQVAGLRPLDMSVVDGLVFSGHKSLYGPYGVAGIGFEGDWRPQPLIYGGTGTHSDSIEMPASGADRYESGSLNISAIAGLHAALEWLSGVGRDAINGHITELAGVLLETLSNFEGVKVYRPEGAEHCGIVSFSVRDTPPQAVENVLGAKNIAVRAGLHCAPWAHDFVGTGLQGGTTRVSLGFFNLETDIECLAEAIATFA